MSELAAAIERGRYLHKDRRIVPIPFTSVYLVLLYSVEEVDDFLAYRSHDPDQEFRQSISNPGAISFLGNEYLGRSKCVLMTDDSIVLYVPERIHTNGYYLVSETTAICTEALLHIARMTLTDLNKTWVTLTNAVGYLQTIVIGFIGNYSGNAIAMVHPLVKQFDNKLYNSQIVSAMKGMSPLECQQALYRQNIERQNGVVMPKLQSWVSTTYYQ